MTLQLIAYTGYFKIQGRADKNWSQTMIKFKIVGNCNIFFNNYTLVRGVEGVSLQNSKHDWFSSLATESLRSEQRINDQGYLCSIDSLWPIISWTIDTDYTVHACDKTATVSLWQNIVFRHLPQLFSITTEQIFNTTVLMSFFYFWLCVTASTSGRV